MKSKLLSAVSTLVSLVASVSAGALCLAIFHQPKVPERLIQK